MNQLVLLVDDEMILSLNTSTVLEQHGYKAEYVNSAEKCLQRLEQGERPAIILMDINLGPDRTDGAEATRQINERYDIPVVLHSAYTDKQTIDKTREMTRYGYIQKIPGNEQLVIATIEMALKLHHMERQERESKEQLRAEMKLKEQIAETAPVGIVVLDARGEFIFANREAKRLFALDENGQNAAEDRRWKFTDTEGRPLREPALPFNEVRSTHRAVYDQHRAVHRPDGILHYLSINATPLSSPTEAFCGMVATVSDITAEYLQNKQIEEVNRLLKLLSETNQYLVRIENEEELLEKICRLIVTTGNYPFAWVGYAQNDEGRSIKPVVHAGEGESYLQEICSSWAGETAAQNPVARAIQTGSYIIVDSLQGQNSALNGYIERRNGFTSTIALPLELGGKVIGALNICSSSSKPVADEELQLLQQLAEDVSFGLSHLRNRENRRIAEEALHKSEVKYRTIFNSSNDAIFLHPVTVEGLPGKFLEVNDIACVMLGYEKEELLQMSPKDIVANDERNRETGIMERLGHQGMHTFQVDLRTKHAQMIPVEISSHQFTLDGLPLVLSTARDMSEVRRVEDELREGQRQYRELSTHLQHVQEEQLARLGREIHDDLGQSLTALKMNCTVLERQLSGKLAAFTAQKVARTVEDMKSILMATVSKTRELAKELRPTVLDSAGLLEALEWQSEEYQRYSGIRVVLHKEMEELELDRERALAVFRIVQESLTNVARHSGATLVDLKVSVCNGQLCITICDNGCGFDVEPGVTTFGMMSMRERAIFCGGSLELDSARQKGTRVYLRIPLEAGQ